jgi:hypothetical protein
MTPGLRKLVLTTHITVSVGWLGAVAGFLVLSVTGMTSRDAETVRGAYLAMNLTAWFAIVPLAFGSLLTGIVQSLGTTWGLFRHYWVVAKLYSTVVATIVLLLKMRLIGYVAGVAATASLSSSDLSKPRMELAVHAGGGLLVLLVVTTLSVFKPWGLTRYGQRKLQERRAVPQQLGKAPPAPPGLKVLLVVIGALVAGFIVLHLTGHGSLIHSH